MRAGGERRVSFCAKGAKPRVRHQLGPFLGGEPAPLCTEPLRGGIRGASAAQIRVCARLSGPQASRMCQATNNGRFAANRTVAVAHFGRCARVEPAGGPRFSAWLPKLLCKV